MREEKNKTTGSKEERKMRKRRKLECKRKGK